MRRIDGCCGAFNCEWSAMGKYDPDFIAQRIFFFIGRASQFHEKEIDSKLMISIECKRTNNAIMWNIWKKKSNEWTKMFVLWWPHSSNLSNAFSWLMAACHSHKFNNELIRFDFIGFAAIFAIANFNANNVINYNVIIAFRQLMICVMKWRVVKLEVSIFCGFAWWRKSQHLRMNVHMSDDIRENIYKLSRISSIRLKIWSNLSFSYLPLQSIQVFKSYSCSRAIKKFITPLDWIWSLSFNWFHSAFCIRICFSFTKFAFCNVNLQQ